MCRSIHATSVLHQCGETGTRHEMMVENQLDHFGTFSSRFVSAPLWPQAIMHIPVPSIQHTMSCLVITDHGSGVDEVVDGSLVCQFQCIESPVIDIVLYSLDPYRHANCARSVIPGKAWTITL
jgi:hypothetical protein